MFKLNHRESKSYKFSMISLKILRNKVHGRRDGYWLLVLT